MALDGVENSGVDSVGAVGKKIGMTTRFLETGEAVPVTVVEISSNRVVGVRSLERDGYSAIQITTGKASSSLTKPVAGQYAKAGVEAGKKIWELRLPVEKEVPFAVGDQFGVQVFTQGEHVDVTGVSKGKGFAGVIKRWGFKMQDATHGNSLSHRAPGSIGQNQSPGRVFKGKKMAGHLGSAQITTQSLEVVSVDEGRGLLMVRGAIPGSNGNYVIVRPAVKSKKTLKN